MNARSPMVVTLLGIITEVKRAEDWNAMEPMCTVGYPPSVEGIVIAPPTPVYFVIVASPLLTV